MTIAATRVSAADRLWTVDDVSAFLGVPVSTVYQWRHHRAGRTTVAKLSEKWRAAQLHTDSTAVLVEHAVRLHILPLLGQRQIKDVRPSQVQAWVKDRAEKLAPSTLRVVYTYLSSMFAM